METTFSLDNLEKAPNELLLAYKNADNTSSMLNNPIILFGAGKAGILYFKFLREHYSGPLLFCDNNPAKWATSLMGVPVISFNELINNYSNNYIVITSLDYYDEILKQLVENNLKESLQVGFEILFNRL